MSHVWQVVCTHVAIRRGAIGFVVLFSGACADDPVRSSWAPQLSPTATFTGHTYRVQQLAPLSGGVSSAARSVNRLGQVVGVSVDAAGASRAVMWYRGQVSDLGSLSGGSTEANAISDIGDVVGASTTTAGQQHAFLWRRGVMTDLGTLPGGTYSVATAINTRGQVVGYGDNVKGLRGFLWQGGTMTELPPSPGGRKSRALAINAEGVVAGEGERELQPLHATLWRAGRPRDLGTMQGTRRDFAAAYALNARGQVAGTEASGPPRFGLRAFLWENGNFTDLTAIAGTDAHAYGINDSGEVVGRTVGGTALLWRKGAVVTLAPPADFVSSAASAINAVGVVVGSGLDGAGVTRALVWSR